jgi:hypothetical protein
MLGTRRTLLTLMALRRAAVQCQCHLTSAHYQRVITVDFVDENQALPHTAKGRDVTTKDKDHDHLSDADTRDTVRHFRYSNRIY